MHCPKSAINVVSTVNARTVRWVVRAIVAQSLLCASFGFGAPLRQVAEFEGPIESCPLGEECVLRVSGACRVRTAQDAARLQRKPLQLMDADKGASHVLPPSPPRWLRGDLPGPLLC